MEEKMKTHALCLSLLVPGLALVGCLGFGGDEGGDGGFFISTEAEVLSIDRPQGAITTRSTNYDCDENFQPVTEIDTSYNRFAIAAGKLTVWEPSECKAMILAGASTDIVGTWKGTGVEMNLAIPVEHRPATCTDSVPASEEAEMFKDVSVTYVVAEKKINTTASGTICLGEILATSFAEEGLTVVSKTCNQVYLKDPEGTPMTANVSMSGAAMTVNISYKGKSCTLSQDMPVTNKQPDCAKAKANKDAFEKCMEDAAGAAPLAKALRKGAAGAF